MATFAKSLFSAVNYAAFRPSYPPSIFTRVLRYHQGPKNLCVDLGCGHGPVSRRLAIDFKKVIGTDPSARMIAQASSTAQETNVDFRTGYAQDLDFVADGSLDMVVAGQSAHWFDYDKVWPELTRKIRSGGTLAFWGYKDNLFVDYPKATKILDHYCYGPGDDVMGKYWEQPGRNKLRDRLQEVVPPQADFEDVERDEYEPGTNGPNSGSLGERLMHRKLKLGEMEGYARTFSAYVNWMEANPERQPRSEGGKGDIVDEMFDKMLEAEPEWAAHGKNWRDMVVESEWGSIILLARRK